MKAIITIGHRDYLVKDAKKALEVVTILTAAQPIHGVGYNHYELSAEPVDVSMQALSSLVKIDEPKPKTRKASPSL